jgi:RNA polymerase primary sigma factor
VESSPAELERFPRNAEYFSSSEPADVELGLQLQHDAAGLKEETAKKRVSDSVLRRFTRLDDATQETALRQMRNPGRPATEELKKTKGIYKPGRANKAIPFDFSNKKARTMQKKDAAGERTRTVEELASSRFSFELESTLRMSADTMQGYLRNISVHPLLTAQEEVLLGQTIEDGVAARATLAAKDFSECSEAELRFVIQQGDSAYSTFVLSNLRLVVWTAKKYFAPEGITLLDMIQDGNLGLIRSVEKWDWRKGHRFSTYSTWWIRQSIDRGLGLARQVRLPEHMRQLANKVKKQASAFYQENGRTPTPEEMAERMGLSAEKYKEVARQIKTTVSLDAPLKGGKNGSKSAADSRTLIDVVQKETQQTPDDNLMASALQAELKHVISTVLTDRQAFVITKRFGLDGGGPCTLQSIGESLGVTRERVRQMESQALTKLKNGSNVKELMASLYQHMLDVENADGEAV